MTTSSTTAPLTLMCPDWCTVAPSDHVAALWDNEGNLIHHSTSTEVADPTGWVGSSFDPPLFHQPIEISVTTSTRPDGVHSATPTIFIDGRETTPAQARALALAITDAVEMVEQA